MLEYSIKDIELLSGIKAHTLRIWEQRYDFINPKRTNTNIRYYDVEDLKLILNISLLKDNGYKISTICNMPTVELHAEVRNLMDKKMGYSEKMQSLTMAIIDLDEDRFEKILSSNILHTGFESTMINLILPFISKIEILWQTGSINSAQKLFLSNLVRQKIIVAIDGILGNSDNAKKEYLIFLPEHEHCEIHLLLASYIVKYRNNKVIYIGQNSPIGDLTKIYDNHNPAFILTTSPEKNQIQKYIELLSVSFPNSAVLLSGFQISNQKINQPHNVIFLSKFQDLIDHIELTLHKSLQ